MEHAIRNSPQLMAQDPEGTRELHLPQAVWERIAQAELLLEVGCGYGDLLALLASRRDGFTCGTDSDLPSLQAAREHYPGLPVFAADSQDAVPVASESLDLIVSSNMFEHLPHPERHLAEMRRILRPGGAYVINTPNATFDTPYWLMVETLNRARGCGLSVLWRWPRLLAETRRYIRQPGLHCSIQSPRSLCRLLRHSGFRCLQLVKQPPTSTQREKFESLPAPLRLLLLPAVRLLPLMPYALQWSIVGVFIKE